MYQRILVPFDGSAPSRRGLLEAIRLARPLGARLVLLHVADAYPALLGQAPVSAHAHSRDLSRARAQALLDDAAATALAAGVEADTVVREAGSESTADAILAQAGALPCDLIAMGTHGRRGWQHAVLGSDAEQVVRRSSVPVLVMRDIEDAATSPA
ncbi:universal stress protein [Rhizobacter sp. LjRoot28]|uniref:universal stress protein n=1 Tax=Rhizobacter sp. LjRoot28 TaxID=3342309 RepID=UPI003ECFB612